jgi:hypothetical protein
MEMVVFWDVLPCRLALTALTIEAVRTSETLVNLNKYTRRYNPEDSHLQENNYTHYNKVYCEISNITRNDGGL